MDHFDFESFIKGRLAAGSSDVHTEVHLQIDRLLLTAALRFANGNQLHAAKVLGIARQTLRNRLRELNLNITKSIADDQESREHSCQ
jgi:two-component system nitrogen regulation response regulator GlnG